MLESERANGALRTPTLTLTLTHTFREACAMAKRNTTPIAPGDVFHRWTVVALADLGGRRRSRWRVRCACGAERIVRQSRLRSGTTTSCGCAKIEALRSRSVTHGGTVGGNSPEYGTWVNINTRCTNSNIPDYFRYGGRGITVCPEWSSFEQFLADMGPRPSPHHTIERLDNDGPYAPDNCRWATRTEQARNRRSNRKITYAGETLCLSEWAERTGLRIHTILMRLKRGWSVEQTLTTTVPK